MMDELLHLNPHRETGTSCTGLGSPNGENLLKTLQS
jgi:hypothetical protein